MSENLNRSNQDFSKYDSMRIEELEEILRADAMGPERDDSDVDEILYVMEVLAKKRRQNGIAGKTALEAYQDFQQHYLPLVEEAKPKRKANVIPFRRIAAIAACLVLVFSFATSANAFCFRDVWNAVVNWAQETFYISFGEEVNNPRTDDLSEYSSLQDILAEHGVDTTIVPTVVPERYILHEIQFDPTPTQETYIAVYRNGDHVIKVTVQSYLQGYPEQIEMSSSTHEVYSPAMIDVYIVANNNQNRAVWMIDTYECSISGHLSIEEIKLMIDSIAKG